jgi:hypothetical protein
MPSISLQLRTVALQPGLDPSDEATGQRLVEWVRQAVGEGKAAPVAVLQRSGRMDIVGLGPIKYAGLPMPNFLAGLTRSEVDGAGAPEMLALIGVVQAKRNGADKDAPPIPMAVAFVEWPDNRWWFWKALIAHDKREIRPDTEVITTAVDGDALPRMFGRWWSFGRRAKMRVRLTRKPPPAPILDSNLVH